MDINLDNVAKADETQTALNGKVDKVTGKGLSDENYTLIEKNKLASITEIFTTALKNSYDSVVSWVSTYGANVETLIDNTSGTNTGDETQTTIVNKLEGSDLSVKSLNVTGTNGAGYVHLKHQAADAAATGSSTVIYADVNGDIKTKNDGKHYTTFKSSLNTADRTYTMQDKSGTVAHLDDLTPFEVLSNKVTDITGNETSTVKYASIKALLDWFNASRIRGILGVSTLSGSNTGDQDLSGLQPILQSGVNIKTINGNSILGSGNIALGGGGIWGISDSTGIYTYYSTYAAARTAAVSGQTIVLFCDITETTNSYVLKDGVNINGNGYSITFTNTGQGITDNNTAVNCKVFNLEVKRTDSTYYCLYIDSNSTKINGLNSLILSNTNSAGNGLFLDGECSGVFINCAKGVRGEQTTSNLFNFIIKSFGTGYGVYFPSAGSVSNGVIESTSTGNYCLNGYYHGSNLKIKSNGYSAVNINDGTLTNSNIKSITSYGVASNGGKISNCYIESNGSYAVNGGEFENCSIVSTVNFAVRNDSTYLHKCKVTTLLKACCGATNGISFFYDTTFHCKWNNAAGHGVANLTTSTIVDCTFIITNSSAYAITNDYLAPNVVMFGNKVKGTSNIYNASFVTQAQTNTADTKGNVILN